MLIWFEYFQNLFLCLLFGDCGLVVLINMDGKMVVCEFYDFRIVGCDISCVSMFWYFMIVSEGSFVDIVLIDGVWCLYVFWYFDGLLLIVMVVCLEVDIYVVWYDCVILIGFVMVVFVIGFVGLLLLFDV